jgi:hypothetical protein
VKNPYAIFLDVQKLYYMLDQERTLDILEGYGVGPNVRTFLKKVYRSKQAYTANTSMLKEEYDAAISTQPLYSILWLT